MHAPPILGIFGNDLDRLQKYATTLSQAERNQIFFLHKKSLPPVTSVKSIACLFGYSPRFVGLMSKRPASFYRTFEIRKGSNGTRKIEAPRVALKIIQKWISFHLSKSIQLPEHVCGFVPGRTTVDGAWRHCGCKWLLTTDIKNFFQSTSHERVVIALQSIGFDFRGAKTIADLCCLNGHLAQGAPSSPPLSNLVFREIDHDIIRFCESNGYGYSRYADDIAISGMGEHNVNIQDFVESTITSNGYTVASEKTRLAVAPQRRKVYGLLVNGKTPRLTKGYRNRIRALKHLMQHDRIDTESQKEVTGHLSYAKGIALQVKRLESLQEECRSED